MASVGNTFAAPSLPQSLLKFEVQETVTSVEDILPHNSPRPPSSGEARGPLSSKTRTHVVEASAALAEITRSILPNRTLTDPETGESLEQIVSTTLCGRKDVKELAEGLDAMLSMSGVRPKAVCRDREVIFSDCFNELIRQVTLECPERGLLLLRVRDSIRLTISNHLHILRSSLNFGAEKMAVGEEGMEEMNRIITEKERTRDQLKARVLELQLDAERLEAEYQERRLDRDKANSKVLAKLNGQAGTIRTFIAR
jgi:dynein light intermediate chain